MPRVQIKDNLSCFPTGVTPRPRSFSILVDSLLRACLCTTFTRVTSHGYVHSVILNTQDGTVQ